MIRSSWSWPNELCPLSFRTPMMRKGTLRTRSCWPTGSSPANRFLTMVWPTTQTLFWARTSALEKNSPELSDQSRISRYCSETPQTLEFQLPLPPMSWAPLRTIGETAWTRVASRFRRSTSSRVSCTPESGPMRTPRDCMEPGKMVSRLVPMLAIWSWMRFSAPLPMATMTMTAATPIMMPSMVSRVRILFLTIDLKATLIRFFHFMGVLPDRRPASDLIPGHGRHGGAASPAGRGRSAHRGTR